MTKSFWMWAHRSAEKLWHWIYYNKLRPDLKSVGSGVSYCYTYTYRNSNDEEVKLRRIEKEDSVI